MYNDYSKLFNFYQVFDILVVGDFMKNKGFTLVELIAVIVVLGVIILIGSTNVIGQLTGSKKNASKIAMKNLEDAAITYALDKYSIPGKPDFMPNSCAIPYELTAVEAEGQCLKRVSVSQLIDLGFFTDSQNVCNKSSQIMVYKFKALNGDKYVYDFKAYVPDDVCKY